MAIKSFNLSWMKVYDDYNFQYDTHPIRAGGDVRNVQPTGIGSFWAFLGFPAEVRQALITSKVKPTMAIRYYFPLETLEMWTYGHKVQGTPVGNARPELVYLNQVDRINNTGWVPMNLDSFFTDRYKTGELNGLALGGPRDEMTVINNAGNQLVTIEITGEWNTPPTTPTLTTPIGGEVFSGTNNITWTPSTDVESAQNTLRYQIQLSKDNGQSWTTIVSQTTAGAVSHAHNFANESESNLAKIRVRAYDGDMYSGWSESTGVFSIQHNVAPFAPTNLTPNSTVVDRTNTIQLTWRHNDQNPNDLQSKADVQWRTQGTTTWNTISVNSAKTEAFITSNVLSAGIYEWRVRTYDQLGLVGPYSNLAVFTAADPTNAPTIVRPSDAVAVARPVIEWTGGAQQSYQIVIKDTLNNTVWDTGEIVSNIKARTVGVDLVNGATYTINVRIKDSSGLFSSYVAKTVTVSYTPPAKPLLVGYEANGYIAFSIETPTPTGTQPTVDSYEIYKRINDVWTRIAYGVGSSFNDYHVKSGVTYEYYSKAIALNGTTSNSDIVPQSTTFRGSWIHTLQDAEASLQYFRYNGTGYETSFEPESAVMKFAGRKRPVVHFGAYEEYSLTVRIQAVEGMSDMDVLKRFVRDRETVCYRDADGNLIVGHILALNVEKEYRVSSAVITIIEADFNEEV